MEKDFGRPKFGLLSCSNPFKKGRYHTFSEPEELKSKVTFKTNYNQQNDSNWSVKTRGRSGSHDSNYQNKQVNELFVSHTPKSKNGNNSRYLPVSNIFTMPEVNSLATKPYSQK